MADESSAIKLYMLKEIEKYKKDPVSFAEKLLERPLLMYEKLLFNEGLKPGEIFTPMFQRMNGNRKSGTMNHLFVYGQSRKLPTSYLENIYKEIGIMLLERILTRSFMEKIKDEIEMIVYR